MIKISKKEIGQEEKVNILKIEYPENKKFTWEEFRDLIYEIRDQLPIKHKDDLTMLDLFCPEEPKETQDLTEILWICPICKCENEENVRYCFDCNFDDGEKNEESR